MKNNFRLFLYEKRNSSEILLNFSTTARCPEARATLLLFLRHNIISHNLNVSIFSSYARIPNFNYLPCDIIRFIEKYVAVVHRRIIRSVPPRRDYAEIMADAQRRVLKLVRTTGRIKGENLGRYSELIPSD